MDRAVIGGHRPRLQPLNGEILVTGAGIGRDGHEHRSRLDTTRSMRGAIPRRAEHAYPPLRSPPSRRPDGDSSGPAASNGRRKRLDRPCRRLELSVAEDPRLDGDGGREPLALLARPQVTGENRRLERRQSAVEFERSPLPGSFTASRHHHSVIDARRLQELADCWRRWPNRLERAVGRIDERRDHDQAEPQAEQQHRRMRGVEALVRGGLPGPLGPPRAARSRRYEIRRVAARVHL